MMPSKKALLIILASIILVGCLARTFSELPKTSPADNSLSYSQVTIEGKNFQIVKLDPAVYQLKIIENLPPPDSRSIQEIHRENQSLLSFNGSFFSQEFKPLGLLVSEGKLISPQTRSELMNGLFTINQKGQPQLLTYNQFQESQNTLLPTIDFAIQSGPILIDAQGKVTIDRKNNKIAGRTAIGLDSSDNLVLIILRQSLLDHKNALTLYDFASLVNTDPQISSLGIHSLLNLDGGNSSGLAVGEQYFPELEKVQNVIIVQKRIKND